MAFDHAYITPFSVLDLTDMSPPTSLKIEGILSGVERPALSSRLIWVELPSFPSEVLLGDP